jgi:hypothetical protein
LQVEFHGFAQAQAALHQGAHPSFTDIPGNAAGGLNPSNYQWRSLMGMLNSARGYLRTGSFAYIVAREEEWTDTACLPVARFRNAWALPKPNATSESEAAGQALPIAKRLHLAIDGTEWELERKMGRGSALDGTVVVVHSA